MRESVMAKRRRSREFKNNQVIDIEAARRERRERRKLAAADKAQKAKEPRREPSRRQAVKSMRRRIVYGLIFIVIGAIIGVSAYNVITLKMEEAEAQARLDVLMEEKQALEEELALVDSAEYIEQQAREQLRMIMPGEILYVLREREKAEDETAN
jgi:cell division protein DivIC